MDKTGIAITLVIAAAVGAVGIGVAQSAGIAEEIEEEREIAQAYCYQAFGDASVYSAAVVGGHGGFHCAANEHAAHYHEVTAEARQAAVAANRSGKSVDWSEVDRYKDSSPTERYYSPLTSVLPVGLVVGGGAVVVGLLQRWRADNTDEPEVDDASRLE